MRLFALASICSIFMPSLQQLCSGGCGSYISINVTVPKPVTIPCGDLQLSNTSTADYCNATDGINEPLVEGATTLYNLTVTEISHRNNVIYCTDNQNKIFCYRLNVFFAPFVPSDFIPSSVSIMDADTYVILICPFGNAGNPLPVCTWRRFDSQNISHQLTVDSRFFDPSNCSLRIIFHEDDNGLYQCTGRNEVGNNTYTFPKRFIVEKCAIFGLFTPSLVINQPPLFSANENVTLLCSASAVTKHASLIWMVDGVIYNSTGVFSNSRGQLMVVQSVFNVSICTISSSLTVLNAQSNSEGVYTCIVQDNSFVNESLMLQLQMNDSTEGTLVAPIVGGTLAGVVGFLLILITLLTIATCRRNQHNHPTDTSTIMNNY